MKDQKQIIIDDLLGRINASPFMLIADYKGFSVTDFSELRSRLSETGSECHVVKNSYVKRAAKEAELPEELGESLVGQTAVVTGEQDICAAAKVLKDFASEFEKAPVKVGVLDGKLLSADQVNELAALPSREVLLAQLLGVLQAPATKLARVLNEPASALARVLKAYGEKGAGGPGASADAPAAQEAPVTEEAPEEAPANGEAPAAEDKGDEAPAAQEAPATGEKVEEAPAAQEAPATEDKEQEAPAEEDAAEEKPAAE
ncbi:MAG: 50S ribosomal protein L10 [Verrucomicrobiales bacterium]